MRALTPKLGIKTIIKECEWMVVVLPVDFALQAILSPGPPFCCNDYLHRVHSYSPSAATANIRDRAITILMRALLLLRGNVKSRGGGSIGRSATGGVPLTE